MKYIYLKIPLNDIPLSVRDDIPTFSSLLFSNDSKYFILKWRNIHGDIVQDTSITDRWLATIDDKGSFISHLESVSTPYTLKELQAEFGNPESVWYRDEES